MFEPTGLETHGPLGILWVSIGLVCFYIALLWVNTVLMLVINSMVAVPLTWLMDMVKGRKDRKAIKAG